MNSKINLHIRIQLTYWNFCSHARAHSKTLNLWSKWYYLGNPPNLKKNCSETKKKSLIEKIDRTAKDFVVKCSANTSIFNNRFMIWYFMKSPFNPLQKHTYSQYNCVACLFWWLWNYECFQHVKSKRGK